MKLVTEKDLQDAANRIGCSLAAVKAVCTVEAPRGGFNPDGTPVTLFEGHIFSKYTKGKYDLSHPHISYPKWTRVHYGRTWQAEQLRIQEAMALDRKAALMSASWGKFQIMGFNYTLCGFKTLQQFVNAMYRSEDGQLDAFVEYILATGLGDELREERWADFARYYNGPLYWKNKYDIKLAKAYDKAKGVA